MKKISKLLVVLTVAAMVLSMVSIVGHAAGTPVAKVGDTEYDTVAAAIAAVEDGGTVQLLAGEVSEEIKTGRISKSFTVLGAENHTSVLTGGLRIGTDVSSLPIQECTVTVKGIAFKNIALSVCDVRNVVVEDNKFTNITGTAAIYILDSATDAQESNITVKNNVVDGAEQGIRIRTGYNIEITGNTVKNTQHNAITIEHGSKWPGNAGEVNISNNTFENWALGGEGRVVRAAFGTATTLEKEIAFTGNKMARESEPAEEYAKLTGVGTVAVDFEKNYWNSDAPDFDTILLVEGGNTETEVAEFYKAETMEEKDLNTYVAPPVNEENKEPEKEETKKEETKKEDTKKEETKSPKTGDNSLYFTAVFMISAAIIILSTYKIKCR